MRITIKVREELIINILGVGSSPRANKNHAMYDPLSIIMLQDLLDAVQKVSDF